MFKKFFDIWRKCNQQGPLSLGLGAALIAVTSWQYRIDRVSCSNWPGLDTNLIYSVLCLSGMLLMFFGWIRIVSVPRNELDSGWIKSTKKIFAWGIALHLIILTGLPFLSQDSIFYCALGRSMAVFHQSAYTPMISALPSGDVFLAAIPLENHTLVTPYGPGFHLLAWLLGKIGGSDLVFDLRMYQSLGLILTLGTAWLTKAAVRQLCRGRDTPGESAKGQTLANRAAALVLFCPLTLVEATLNAHNDMLLALSVALFALLVVQGRAFWGLTSLAVGFLIKFSGALMLGFSGLTWFFSKLKGRLNKKIILALLGLALLAGTGLWLLLKDHLMILGSEVIRIVGEPTAADLHCTRAIECLPRLLFGKALGLPLLSFLTGIVFRLAGLLWLIYCVKRAVQEQKFLQWAGTFLFIYLMFFHSWSLSWYRLSLVPLLPFASKRIYPAMLGWIAGALIYYALDLTLTCQHGAVFQVLGALSQAIFLMAMPIWFLVRHGKSSWRSMAEEIKEPHP